MMMACKINIVVDFDTLTLGRHSIFNFIVICHIFHMHRVSPVSICSIHDVHYPSTHRFLCICPELIDKSHVLMLEAATNTRYQARSAASLHLSQWPTEIKAKVQILELSSTSGTKSTVEMQLVAKYVISG
jgi:hypothetical protein